MKKVITLLFISAMVFVSKDIIAQFSLKADLRTRSEYRNGYKTLPTEETSGYLLTHQRSRLIATYIKDDLKMNVSIQDSRVWGDSKFRQAGNRLDVFEAWAEYEFMDNLSIKLGRQQVYYDDKKLFTTADWTDWGQTLDLALLKYQPEEDMQIHFALGVNNNADSFYKPFLDSYQVNQPRYLGYLWLHHKFSKKFKLSFYYVADGSQNKTNPNTIYIRHTIGPYFKLNANGLLANGSFFYQTGRSFEGKKIEALSLGLGLGYQWTNTLNLTINLDHRSGSDISKASFGDKTKSFNNLYGPGHKDLGYMDYFVKADLQTSHAGINDIFLKMQLFPKQKWSAYAALHLFLLDQYYIENPINENIVKLDDKTLGKELDLVSSWNIKSYINLSAGFSFLIANSPLEILKSAKDITEGLPAFGWLQLRFTPNLLSTK